MREWGIPLALYSDRHAAFKYNARQGPVLYESTQFARVMRELGIQQIFALSPQAKGRVERMASTFQDRLVTELRLTGASTIDGANMFLREFLPRFNHRFAVTAEQPETAYRPVPEDLSLTETVSIRHTRKVARDNTVKYQWRVLQLLPSKEWPSYSGLRVDLLERSDGELMIRYQRETVDFQEATLRSPALWGEGSGSFPSPEESEVADGAANGHLDEGQRKLPDGSGVLGPAEGQGQEGNRPGSGNPGESPSSPAEPHTYSHPSKSVGKRCNRPDRRACPCGISPGNWAWHATPSESTPKRRTRPPNYSAPRNGPRPKPWPNHRSPPINHGDIFAFQ